ADGRQGDLGQRFFMKQLVFNAAPLGDVPQHAGVQRAAGVQLAADGELGQKGGSIPAPAFNLALYLATGTWQKVRLPVLLAQQPMQGDATGVRGQSEQAPGPRIQAGQDPILGEGNDAVADIPQNRLGPLHGLPQRADDLVVLPGDLADLGKGLDRHFAPHDAITGVVLHRIQQLHQLGAGTVLGDIEPTPLVLWVYPQGKAPIDRANDQKGQAEAPESTDRDALQLYQQLSTS